MQQYLTLEEAAKMLQLSADELREMARKKTIRAFQDRGTWRFRLQDMEEEARKRGINSDPEVRLGDSHRLAEDDEVPIGREKPSSHGPRSSKTKSPPPTPKPGSDSDVRLVLDEDVQFSIDVDSDRRKADLAGPKSSRGNIPKNPKRQSRLDSVDSGVRLVGGPNDPSDSDVKVVPSDKDSGVGKKPHDPSDSDIRLGDLPSSDKKKGRDANVITEEIDLDAEEARLAKKGKDPGKKQPTMMKGGSQLPTQSPFEISEPDFDLDRPSAKLPKPKKKSEVDSSSDFELIPFDASKSPDVPILADDDVDLGGEVAGGRTGNSGINLDDPADGGISLESGGSDEQMEFELTLDDDPPSKASSKAAKPDDDSSSEFELSLDDSSSDLSVDGGGDNSSSEFELSVDDSDEAGSSEFELSLDASDESAELSAVEENSDSEFELTLDDDGGLAGDEDGKDIFEDTSFDVPALDDESGSEAVAIDDADTDLEGSDFEVSLDEDSSTDDEAGSEVVNLDEEEQADEGAATVARAKKPAKKGKIGAAVIDDEPAIDLDIEDSGPAAKKGKQTADDEDADSDDELDRPAAAAPVASDWGAFPAIFLFPTVMVLFVVGLMGFELVRGMWGYHRPSAVGRPIIDSLARQIDDTLPK
jgi:excisionase family DNA binding protein